MIAQRFQHARRIHLVLDNLNTHSEVSLVNALGELESRRLGRRFVQRIPSLVDLISRGSAWRIEAQRAHRIIDWKFRVHDARRVFRYGGLTTARSGH